MEMPAFLQYSLWLQRGSDAWIALGSEETDDRNSHHWIFAPPLLVGSEIAYAYSVMGCEADSWLVRITVRQRRIEETSDAWRVCASWTECGVLDEDGSAGVELILAQARRVTLYDRRGFREGRSRPERHG
jgi:hypothetical protein